MKVNYRDDEVFVVHWIHIRSRSGHPHGGKTKCIVRRMCNGKFDVITWSEGIAKCHPDDNYNKATGRKLSLTNALERGFGGSNSTRKGIRTQFWEAYRKECK
jgi:hypothetical protein